MKRKEVNFDFNNPNSRRGSDKKDDNDSVTFGKWKRHTKNLEDFA